MRCQLIEEKSFEKYLNDQNEQSIINNSNLIVVYIFRLNYSVFTQYYTAHN